MADATPDKRQSHNDLGVRTQALTLLQNKTLIAEITV
jgi:hypothetical protein